MLYAKSSENLGKIGQILAVLGVWGSGLQKVSILLQKAHVFVLAILRQNRSRGVASRSVGEKTRKSQRLP